MEPRIISRREPAPIFVQPKVGNVEEPMDSAFNNEGSNGYLRVDKVGNLRIYSGAPIEQ